jgi:ribosomal protein S3
MSHARVSLTGAPASIPFAQVPDVAADLVVVDWQLVAEQIVSDLISRIAFNRAETTTLRS